MTAPSPSAVLLVAAALRVLLLFVELAVGRAGGLAPLGQAALVGTLGLLSLAAATLVQRVVAGHYPGAGRPPVALLLTVGACLLLIHSDLLLGSALLGSAAVGTLEGATVLSRSGLLAACYLGLVAVRVGDWRPRLVAAGGSAAAILTSILAVRAVPALASGFGLADSALLVPTVWAARLAPLGWLAVFALPSVSSFAPRYAAGACLAALLVAAGAQLALGRSFAVLGLLLGQGLGNGLLLGLLAGRLLARPSSAPSSPPRGACP